MSFVDAANATVGRMRYETDAANTTIAALRGQHATQAQKLFSVGDVVRLTHGGLSMTVDDRGQIRPYGAIDCIWFDPAGQLHRDAFLPATLVKSDVL